MFAENTGCLVACLHHRFRFAGEKVGTTTIGQWRPRDLGHNMTNRALAAVGSGQSMLLLLRIYRAGVRIIGREKTEEVAARYKKRHTFRLKGVAFSLKSGNFSRKTVDFFHLLGG